MQRPALIKTNLNFDAFLEFEMHSQGRHEFADVHLLGMFGGSQRAMLRLPQLDLEIPLESLYANLPEL
jgi:hypothetical protein